MLRALGGLNATFMGCGLGSVGRPPLSKHQLLRHRGGAQKAPIDGSSQGAECSLSAADLRRNLTRPVSFHEREIPAKSFGSRWDCFPILILHFIALKFPDCSVAFSIPDI